ncbi:MAG: porphobilinogen synthase, partial [Candidatus Omnitrophica bacterium]|nr:porphobilinogen synthase [Candidatus Omnitrophota bacterium]
EAIKEQLPDLLIITDVCLCAYMSHGHCGVLKQKAGKQHTAHSKQIRKKSRDPGRNMPVNERDWWIDNDATLELLSKTALSHAQAGADLIAPSDMMDGNVGAIRQALDAAAFEHIPIMAYSTKYASSFYGPFRNAVDSTPQIGDRRSYQMDPANSDEAIRKALRDIEEGADILMVKPALAYLDIIRRVKQELNYPVAAFNVSGEYALVKAAASRGWIAERPVWMEILLSIKRAGADILITYWAKEAAKILGKSNV